MNTKINHIAIVVEDIKAALAVYRDLVGLAVDHIAEETAEQVRVAILSTENGDIELVEPTSPDSGVAKFLARQGEGLHHICLEVEDMGTTVNQMKAHGLDVLGEPRINDRGEKYIFIHPKSAHGVLLELYERNNL
ncbi:MAG: methylmalonyl-CoA epimerase [Anaerolineae bacterium]|jgi:methylmalonyl-CoA/ethylmalonyl-CoA epimerase|nr:methylmalonyl-CoA epimerase [Anaerolineae bacterium]